MKPTVADVKKKKERRIEEVKNIYILDPLQRNLDIFKTVRPKLNYFKFLLYPAHQTD